MPYFSIQTNRSVDPATLKALVVKASAFAADLVGKPEAYVMTAIMPDVCMTFAGSDGPAAFIQLKSIGLAESQCGPFAEAISRFVQANLGIEPDRVFIDLTELPRTRFAWNGKTFG